MPQRGPLIDGNTRTSNQSLGKVLKGLKEWEQSEVLNTDAAPTHAAAIAELRAERKRPNETRHRHFKNLDNVVEADHGRISPPPANNPYSVIDLAEFETNLRRERQGEGIAAAKQRDAYRGRPPRIFIQAIQHRLAKGLSPTAIARELRVSRGTVYMARAGIA